jgi:hypothetical protein
MKPTQEQVIAWAREAGIINCDCCLPFWPEEDQVNWEIFFERLAALAYEAGRKDENKECAVIAFNAKTYIEAAAAIRARREQ